MAILYPHEISKFRVVWFYRQQTSTLRAKNMTKSSISSILFEYLKEAINCSSYKHELKVTRSDRPHSGVERDAANDVTLLWK